LTPSPEWLIVVNAEGLVLAVAGGAPREWIGAHLDGRADVPADLRQAAAVTLREFNRAVTHPGAMSMTIASTGQPVRLLMIHALPVHRVPTDVRRLLESATQVMQPQARGADVALTLDIAESVPRLLALDPEKVAWTITALVGNALRFVAHGTRLRPGGTIEVRAALDAGQPRVIVEVRDNGRGIPKDRLSQLMERRPDQLHPSALTLSIVREFVAAHGGSLQLESRTEADRSGTTVRLSFPCG
jgi:signal transduction histidine kinase